MVYFNDIKDSFEHGRYGFSNFLSLSDVSDFHVFQRENPFLPYTLFGGKENCERVILRIGNKETLGYDQPFPIAIIKISPKNPRFSDELTHRDFLGSVLGLGLERTVIGDILIEENTAYLFCIDTVAPFIIENLKKVKHTTVNVEIIEELPALKSEEPKKIEVVVSSNRLDAIIAGACHLSRTKAQELFPADRVYIDGRVCHDAKTVLETGTTVSIRGFGRLVLDETKGRTRKNKIRLCLSVYK